jgi:hypothetical protein
MVAINPHSKGGVVLGRSCQDWGEHSGDRDHERHENCDLLPPPICCLRGSSEDEKYSRLIFFRLGHTLLLVRWDLLPHFKSGSIDDLIFLEHDPTCLFLKLDFSYYPNVTGFHGLTLKDWCIQKWAYFSISICPRKKARWRFLWVWNIRILMEFNSYEFRMVWNSYSFFVVLSCCNEHRRWSLGYQACMVTLAYINLLKIDYKLVMLLSCLQSKTSWFYSRCNARAIVLVII